MTEPLAGDHHAERELAGEILRRALVGEGAVAVIKEDIHGIRVELGGDDVGFAVAIQVGDENVGRLVRTPIRMRSECLAEC